MWVTGKLSDGELIAISPQCRIKCLCGIWVTLGERENGVPAVLHPTPTCDLFDRLDLQAYIHALREYYESQVAIDDSSSTRGYD